MVVNEYVDRALLTDNALPNFLSLLLVREVRGVKVHFLECYIARDRLNVLLQLRLEVGTNVNDNYVDAVKRVAAHKLLGEQLS